MCELDAIKNDLVGKSYEEAVEIIDKVPKHWIKNAEPYIPASKFGPDEWTDDNFDSFGDTTLIFKDGRIETVFCTCEMLEMEKSKPKPVIRMTPPYY